MNKPLFHYDTMEKLWLRYLDGENGNMDLFCMYAVHQYRLNGDPLSEDDAMLIWQTYDMMYGRVKESLMREMGIEKEVSFEHKGIEVDIIPRVGGWEYVFYYDETQYFGSHRLKNDSCEGAKARIDGLYNT